MSSPDPHGPAPEHVGSFQLIVLALSVVALTAIAAESFLPVPHEVRRILEAVDRIACGVFFLDFVLRFSAAKSKAAFMKLGWIDLLASVPNVEFLRVGRFVYVFRVLRLFRGVRSLGHLLKIVYHNKRRGGVASVALLTFLVVVLASIGILLCETDPQAKIRSAGDAVWWSVTTVTTVGYGDLYPVTTGGRVIAALLMFAGVGLLGALSGVMAMILLGRPEPDPALMAEVRGLRAEIDHLHAKSAPPTPGPEAFRPPT